MSAWKPSNIKSKERVKELGEVFTPPTLVGEMLNKLPTGSWEHAKTFLEPSCGTGNFLVQIVQRKIGAGSTPLQALATTFGIDIMADNVNECRGRLIQTADELEPLDAYQKVVANWIVCSNIVCGNALEGTMENKFASSNTQRGLRRTLIHDPLYFQNRGHFIVGEWLAQFAELPLL